MTAEGHLLFSVASIIMAHKLEITPEIANGDWLHMLPGVLLTALLPDIDHPNSTLGRLFRFISIPIAKLCGHRGFTHSLLALALGIALLWLKIPEEWPVPTDFFHAMIIGYLSHLVADMLTPAGVPLLWPIKTRFRLSVLGKQGNKKAERFISALLVVIAVFLPEHIEYSILIFIDYIKKLYF